MIRHITAGEGYTLLIDFEDGSRKVFDMSALLEWPCYSRLKDRRFFGRVYVSCGGAAWDEEIDIAPEYLYEHGENIT